MLSEAVLDEETIQRLSKEWFILAGSNAQYRKFKSTIYQHFKVTLSHPDDLTEAKSFGQHVHNLKVSLARRVDGEACPASHFVMLKCEGSDDSVNTNTELLKLVESGAVERYDTTDAGDSCIFTLACASEPRAMAVRRQFGVRSAFPRQSSMCW